MNRRNAVKSVSLLTMGAFGLPGMDFFLEGCNREFKSGSAGNFTADERKMISRMVDIMIPATDTPGALETGVPAFMMRMIGQCYELKIQQDFHAGLLFFENECRQKYGASFTGLNPEKQLTAMKELDHEIFGANKGSKQYDQRLGFYRTFKMLTISGFFTSKDGATKTLRYLPIPGHYSGNIPYHKGDREWAT